MRSILAVGTLLLSLGCSTEATEQHAQAQQAAEATKGAENAIEGTVLEAMDASSYTYVLLDTGGQELWAAVPQTKVAVGDHITVVNATMMGGFESETLGRKFDSIAFGTLAVAGAADTAAAYDDPHSEGMPTVGAHDRTTAIPDAAGVEIARAEGENGRTVGEIFAEKADLSGKTITLRGKVVKYSGGIMGRNWIHLQDGSGDSSSGTHDITVTSSDAAKVGEVIVVEGLVTLDKDFGSGYRYDVIVEEAKVSR